MIPKSEVILIAVFKNVSGSTIENPSMNGVTWKKMIRKPMSNITAELLISEEEISHLGRRCIEPESVFGQIKNNMGFDFAYSILLPF